MSWTGTLWTWGRMVRFSHSLFALPFAFSGAALAAAVGQPSASRVAWIIVAMVCARNAAMGFNRLADQAHDARNPRTAGRELPRGALSRRAVWVFTILLAAGFAVAAERLGLLWFAPFALFVVFGYSYTKRFTWASHLVLGLALALAPLGGWLAIEPRPSWTVVALALGVLTWVAGFDLIYACQDAEFDRSTGSHSIPARFGVGRALAAARWLHAGTLGAFAAVGVLAGLHPVYWLGWAAVGALLVQEHRLVCHDDLTKVGAAFFNLNAVIGAVYLVAVLAAVWLGGG